MITIQTLKTNKSTGNPIYKDYRHTGSDSIKLTMEIINDDRLNNDLSKYSPIEIYNIYDDKE